MSIRGLGVDVVSVSRVRRLLQVYPQRFPQRILHSAELKDYRRTPDKPAFLARRFAAKEAIGKALGRGLAAGVYARKIHIDHHPSGAPCAHVSGTFLLPCAHHIWISISDERDYSVAFAVYEVLA